MLVPVRHVEGVRRKKLVSDLNGPTQGPCKRGHSKKGTRPDIMTSTSTYNYLSNAIIITTISKLIKLAKIIDKPTCLVLAD